MISLPSPSVNRTSCRILAKKHFSTLSELGKPTCLCLGQKHNDTMVVMLRLMMMFDYYDVWLHTNSQHQHIQTARSTDPLIWLRDTTFAVDDDVWLHTNRNRKFNFCWTDSCTTGANAYQLKGRGWLKLTQGLFSAGTRHCPTPWVTPSVKLVPSPMR